MTSPQLKRHLKIRTARLSPYILVEVVGPPALARAGNQEPIVVQPHLKIYRILVSLELIFPPLFG